jgi:hypothetical protein
MDEKVEHIIFKYLDLEYGDLIQCGLSKQPGIVFFFKDERVYMEHNILEMRLIVDYNTLWTDLEDIFGLKSREIKDIITKWTKETYELRGVTPIIISSTQKTRWKTLVK